MTDEILKKWLIRAFEDYRTIENEFKLSKKEVVTSSVCFHAQQFVEKLLKAYLSNNGIEFGRTHNLEFLLQLCKNIDDNFKNIDTKNLSYYAVELRYPDEFYIPTYDEAKECFELAKKAKDFILEKLNVIEKDLKSK
ncbi:MAG: DNA-binding protein [bacterium]|nr:MAG: DNA-binding protein [bacterium]